MSDKRKWPRPDALAVALQLRAQLSPLCARIEIAGSIRREKPLVGDVELVFIPRTEERPDPTDLFAPPRPVDLAAKLIESLVGSGILARRLKINGSPTWGQANKLATHTATEIPVDLFATTEEAWFNYLVCRTGGAVSNMQIASRARERGWQWNPTAAGFSRLRGPDRGRVIRMESEEAVFAFVGLPYLPPTRRQ